MRVALALIAVVTASCRYDLDSAEYRDAAQPRPCAPSSNVQSCLGAEAHSDFTYIYSTMLKPKCTFSGCHNGASTQAGMHDYRTLDAAYSHLVGAASELDTSRVLVVPGDVSRSFLMVMVGSYKPSEAEPPLAAIPQDDHGMAVGTMPQDAPVMCCQKVDAIGRWIAAGAAKN